MGVVAAGDRWCYPGWGVRKAMQENELQSACPAARTTGSRQGTAWLWWGAAGVVCLGVLVVAAWLQPHGDGVGTHEQLGLPACGFYERTGYPCPTCGMTTAFAHVARGHVLRALSVQPAGTLAALVCVAGVVAGGYSVVTGRTAKLVGLWINPIRTIFWVAAIVTASWLWLCLLTYLRHK